MVGEAVKGIAMHLPARTLWETGSGAPTVPSLFVGIFLALVFQSASAVDQARIAIIIDDVGDREVEGTRAVELPGPVAVALLPHRPHTRSLAQRAHDAGKEVMLHLPLAAVSGRELGEGAIELDTTEPEFRRLFRENLDAVPHAIGVNTHMGSLLTRHPGHMSWLMSEIRGRAGVFFVDSYTAVESVALTSAKSAGISATRRDVFFDTDADAAAIEVQFERLIALARERGVALAIGHPYPETLAVLERELPRLAARDIELVSVRELIELQSRNGEWSWHASSFATHCVAPTAAKSTGSPMR